MTARCVHLPFIRALTGFAQFLLGSFSTLRHCRKTGTGDLLRHFAKNHMTTKCGAFIGTSGDVKSINEVIPNSVHIISQYIAKPIAMGCITKS